MRRVFPEDYKSLESRRSEDTLFLPVLFKFPAASYGYSESGKRHNPETVRHPSMFVHALVHVAIEVVHRICFDSSPSGTVQILVTSIYNEWLVEFETFLRSSLASVCVYMLKFANTCLWLCVFMDVYMFMVVCMYLFIELLHRSLLGVFWVSFCCGCFVNV